MFGIGSTELVILSVILLIMGVGLFLVVFIIAKAISAGSSRTRDTDPGLREALARIEQRLDAIERIVRDREP
ncbi:MAG: hypothetical protein HZB26_25785 [Candidatus Hydrogenedentes bacterium]|nr:hypothetical protein [Candidatus Hydrogenedentota bacterium]